MSSDKNQLAYEKQVGYQNGEDVGYKEGYEDALRDVAEVMCHKCGSGCPFEEDCEVVANVECVERIIDCFGKEFKIYGL